MGPGGHLVVPANFDDLAPKKTKKTKQLTATKSFGGRPLFRFFLFYFLAPNRQNWREPPNRHPVYFLLFVRMKTYRKPGLGVGRRARARVPPNQSAMGIPEPNVTVAPGNVEKGAKIFKTKCAQCHNADQVRADAASARADLTPEGGGRIRGSRS